MDQRIGGKVGNTGINPGNLIGGETGKPGIGGETGMVGFGGVTGKVCPGGETGRVGLATRTEAWAILFAGINKDIKGKPIVRENNNNAFGLLINIFF